MDDVDLSSELLDSSRHDVVVERQRAHGSDELIRNSEFSAGQGRTNPDAVWQRFMHRPWKHQDVRSSSLKTSHLLPGRIADSACADLVRKAVQHPNWPIRSDH